MSTQDCKYPHQCHPSSGKVDDALRVVGVAGDTNDVVASTDALSTSLDDGIGVLRTAAGVVTGVTVDVGATMASVGDAPIVSGVAVEPVVDCCVH